MRRTYPSSSRRGEDLEIMREEIAFFAGFNMTPERIAERVGLTPGAIEQRGWRKK